MAGYRFEPIPVSEDERRKYSEMNVTLDGEPAKVCGVQNDFATVRSAKNHEEFSWYAVRTVIEKSNGAFQS